MRFASCLTLFLLAFPSYGQEPIRLVIKGDTEIVDIERTVLTIVKEKREVVKKLPFDVQCPSDAFRPHWTVPAGVTYTTKGRILTITAAPRGELKIDADWGVIKTGEEAYGSITFNIGDVVPIPPTPPGPIPPDPKPPQPVLLFRVIMVYESGDTLTAAQNAVLYGKKVEDFLNVTCTGGKSGWRRRDKDLGGENDPAMAAVWSAVRSEFAAPKNTKTPAVVVQVNDKIEIVPVAPTQADMVAVLKKYSEGK